MKVLLDTNVVLDALLDRHPWVESASLLWSAARDRVIMCFLTASALTDIYYISRIYMRRGGISAGNARQIVRDSLDALTVIGVDGADLERAYSRQGVDFEDDLPIVCAERKRLDAIVTRDPAGFSKSSIPIFSTSEFMFHLRSLGILRLGDDVLPEQPGSSLGPGQELMP